MTMKPTLKKINLSLSIAYLVFTLFLNFNALSQDNSSTCRTKVIQKAVLNFLGPKDTRSTTSTDILAQDILKPKFQAYLGVLKEKATVLRNSYQILTQEEAGRF